MGLKTFGELEPGDRIRGAQGQPVTVTKSYEPHIPEEMWEIELQDGSTIKASGNHLWYIETTHDYKIHAQRRQVGKEIFKGATPEAQELLLRVATSPDPVDTTLIDMVTLLEGSRDERILWAVERVAEAIGHISENSEYYEDLDTGERFEGITVRTYDARIFAQQLLSLSGKREHRKRWPLLAGRVITTRELVTLENVDVPVLTPRGATSEGSVEETPQAE